MRKEHLSLISENIIQTQCHPTCRRGIRPLSYAGSPPNGGGGKNKQENILIVEDNPMARMALENILVKLGEAFDIAIDGEQAIKKIKIYHYRLILMDISLPKKDGCAVTKMIRNLEEKHNLPPAYIVAQSSHLDETVEKECLAAGMNVCYHKPLSLEIIANLLKIISCLV